MTGVNTSVGDFSLTQQALVSEGRAAKYGAQASYSEEVS